MSAAYLAWLALDFVQLHALIRVLASGRLPAQPVFLADIYLSLVAMLYVVPFGMLVSFLGGEL